MISNLFGPDLGYVVIIILVVLVGGSQLPKIARNIGTAGKEFRKAQQEAEEEAQRERAAQAPPAVSPAPAPPAVSDAGPASPEEQPFLHAREDQERKEAAR
jgi:sec-independent protein translocase protein TatA